MTHAQHIFHIPYPDRLVQSIRTQLRAPEIDIDTVREVLSLYDLELKGRPRNLTVNKRNLNLIVNTSAGRKVFKRYWHGWPSAVMIHEHSILAQLARLEFPAPRLVATPTGETLISLGNHNFAVFDLQGGNNYSSNFLLRAHRLRLMTLAGQTLARLHSELKGFVPAGHHHTGFISYTGNRRQDRTWHENKVSELKECSRDQITDPEAKVHAEWLIKNSDPILYEMNRLDEQLSAASLPRLVIHGDYGIHNLHFHKDGMVTPLDFESSRLEWRLRDVVTSLARFRYKDGSFDFESMAYFLKAYESEYPLQGYERHLIPQVWRFCKLQDAVKYWKSYFETNGPTRKLISARDAVLQADATLILGPRMLSLVSKT